MKSATKINKSCSSKVKIEALACMVLHNICIEEEDLISRNLDLSLEPSTNTAIGLSVTKKAAWLIHTHGKLISFSMNEFINSRY